jgi:hypothetical protein
MKLPTFDADKLGIREMTEVYLHEFTCGRESQTGSSRDYRVLTLVVKASILHILGLFCEQFPEHMFDKSVQLLYLMQDSLKYQFKKQKQDYQIISGSIKGLTALLTNFSEELLKSPKDVADLYRYICLGALNPPEGIKTYHIPKGAIDLFFSLAPLAAMGLIAKHAHLFKQYLTEQSPKIYSYLKTYCTHQNKGLRQIAFQALDLFFTEVSQALFFNRS